MVFRRNRGSFETSRNFSISDWSGAPVEQMSGSAHHQHHSPLRSDGSTDVSTDPSDTSLRDSGISDANSGMTLPNMPSLHHTSANIAAPPSNTNTNTMPEMNLGSVYNAIQNREASKSKDCDADAVSDAPAGIDESFSTRPSTIPRRRHSQEMWDDTPQTLYRKSSSGNYSRKSSVTKLFKRRGSDATADTLSSRTSYSSSAGTNIWTKLLGGNNEALWDGINGKDAFDDNDDELLDDDQYYDNSCSTSTKRCGLSWWYEVKHWTKTVYNHPHIWMLSFAAFGALCGVGMLAINSQRDKFVAKQQMTADFIARETGEWFSNEFRKAMLPLYSIQQGVVHSNYFDDAATKIGRYPNRVIPETENEMKIMRDVSGICDDPDLQLKFRQIVQPINKENNLDGAVFAYRLAPANVFCLYERGNMDSPDKHFGFDVGSSSQIPFWSGVTEDIFIHKEFSMFGPFAIPDKKDEVICGHIPIYKSGSEGLNVHGQEVPEAWGFVMNYLDWGLLKSRSNVYERFAGCKLDFQLTSRERDDGAFQNFGPFPENNVLAESPNAALLDETNSVVIETESLHGVWKHRVGRIDGWGPPWYNAAVAAVVLGSLLLAFLTASTLVERQLHRNLVNKMLPRKAIAKLHRGQTVLEKYNLVTIFFSDIVGFTSMAGSMRPIQVMKMLNELYTELDKLIEKHQVYKVETIGDAYMVVGGAPDRVPAPLAAERVALFALDAVKFVRDFRTKDGDRVFIRAGLASGPVVAGVVGQAMPRYCFFGDTVNFASRMESTSKKMKIQVAELTYRLLLDSPNMDFTMTKRMDGDIAGVVIKGKGHQITYWAESVCERSFEVNKVVDMPPKHILPAYKADIETNGAGPNDMPTLCESRLSYDLPKLSESTEIDDEGKSAVGNSMSSSLAYGEFVKFMMNDTSSVNDQLNMYTLEEISSAMSNQEWEKLGHAESVLVTATNDHEDMIIRASALLEHHLDRLLKHRDVNAAMSEAVKFQINKFVREIANTYTDDAKFHNLSHALHVTTSMNKLLSYTLTEDPLNSFALVFSALIHDAGHTGMSNKILSETHHPLSKKFQEGVPIAEWNSIDIGLEIFFREEFEEFRMAILPDVLDQIKFTKTMFQGILVTDIATPDRVKLGIERFAVAQDERGEYDVRLCPLAPYFDGFFDRAGLDEEAKEEFPNEFVITHCGLQNCVRNEHLMLVSDISHLLQNWENFVKWNFRLFKELKECTRKGFCDDPAEGWSQGQIGFLNHYILPLAKRSKIYFDKEFADAIVENGETNLRLWKQHGDEASSIMAAAVDDGEDETDVLLRLYELPTQVLATPKAA